MPSWRRTFGATLMAAVIWTASGCATSRVAPPDMVLRHHSPRETMADSGSVGRFRVAKACIFFDRAQSPSRRVPALFPPATRLSDDRRAILMPDGQEVPFGKVVHVTAERAPFGVRDETCGADPLEVLSVQPAQP